MRLIDADAFTEQYGNYYAEEGPSEGFIGTVGDLIAKQTTIEPEVRRGHWEDIPGMDNTVFCSECLAAANKKLAMRYKGCPFCLAVMNEGADNAESD